MNCIETHQLTHRFSAGETAVDQMDLRVPEGSVFGFLGPNGAGKTTTLRLLLGLLRRQEGRIEIFGKSLEKDRIEILQRTGAMIENPSIYAHLSARENLRILQVIYGCKSSRIADVLKIVGLADTGNKKAGKFSLGMKQRLGIAMALLNDPELLILDEPTNGLDPNGIIEMRELIKRLNQQQGITVLVSSHLLSEVEKLVSHVGVIHHGKLKYQGSMEALHRLQNMSSGVRFSVSDTAKAAAVTGELPWKMGENGDLYFPSPDRDAIASVNKKLMMNGVDVYAIVPVHHDLESIFLQLTQ